jgi:EcsC protein family
MATQIKAARAKSRISARAKLTPYESDQISQIAAWKSRAPGPIAEIARKITQPGGKLIGKVLPEAFVRVPIEQSYRLAVKLAGKNDVKRRAGVADLRDLRSKPLEDCDRLAQETGLFSQVFATAQGAATGAGGVLTTVIDIPLLLILSLRTILKIGHCYGYSLHRQRDQHFVLGVLIAAVSGTLATKRHRLDRIHQLEDWLIHEMHEEILAEELLSVLFQLEVFEAIPGIGAISGAVLNLAFMRKVDETARRVFQERWLKDSGKVQSISPAPVHERDIATGWAGALGRVTYRGCYFAGFGVALPAFVLVNRLAGPADR